MTLLDDRSAPPPPSTPPGHPAAHHVAVVAAVTLLTTAALLWWQLPAVAVAEHWSLAWAGLDIATATVALTTAGLLGADDRRAALSAAAGAALLVSDAWFDVCTATAGLARFVAVVEAVGLELPLAVLAARLALQLLGPTPRRD